MKRFMVLTLVAGLFLLGCDKEKNALRDGNESFGKKEFSKAEDFYRQSLANDSLYSKAQFNLANASYKQNNQDKLQTALKYYEQYLTNTPAKDTLHYADALYNMGNTYFQIAHLDSNINTPNYTSNLKKALENYKQTLRLNPQDTNAKYNLSLTRKLLKENENQNQNQQNQQQNQQNQDRRNQNQERKNQNQERENQNKEREQDKNDTPQPQRQNKDEKEMKRMLEALKNNEKATLEKLKRKEDKQAQKKYIEKDW